jgi:uridine phosphorylase
LVADAALAADGASLALGADGRVLPDPDLTAALAAAAGGRTGTVVTSDLFYDPRPGLLEAWREEGAVAVEMEAATVLQAAAAAGRPAGCVLAVTDELGPRGERRRIDREGLEAAGLRLGEAAAAALTGPGLR